MNSKTKIKKIRDRPSMKGDILSKSKRIIFIAWLGIIFVAFFLDRAVFNFFNAIQVKILTTFFELMEPTIFMIVFIAAAGIFLFLKNKETLQRFCIAVFLTLAVTFFIKFSIGRERPLGTEMMSLGLQDYAFPSAHAALSFCLFAFYNKEFNGFAYLWLAIVALIAFSRIYISAHYISDVIAGALIGYCIGLYFAERK